MSKALYNAACLCKLRPPVKAVLKELAWYSDDAGENIWPSVTTVAERTSLTRRTVQKVLRQLENAGAIRALGSRLGGRSRSTHYRIELAWLSANTIRANAGRRFVSQTHRGNGERQDHESANRRPVNGERGAPEQNEYENEKKENPALLASDGRAQGSYRFQQVRQGVRKACSARPVPGPLSDLELEARRLELKRQAQEVEARMSPTQANRQPAVSATANQR